MHKEKLCISQMMLYTTPTLPIALLFGSLPVIQGIYAKYFGLSLTTIASIILIARVIDAITDPIVGFYSDYYFARKGSRKLFVMMGGVFCVFCSWFLYIPGGIDFTEPYDPVSGFYFLVWLVLFYIAWTLFEIPHLAWGSELAGSSQDKNRIFSLRALGTYLGTLVFYAMPLLPIFDYHGFTPHTLAWAVIISAVLMLPSLYYCFKLVPDQKNLPKLSICSNDEDMSFKTNFIGLRKWRFIMTRNKPFLVFLATFLFAGIGAGMSMGLTYIFAESYLGIGEYLPNIYLLSMGIAMVSIFVWHQLAMVFGKTVSWGIGMIGMSVSFLGLALLDPGEDSWLSLLWLQVSIYTCSTAAVVFPPAMLSSIIDYGSLKFGQDYSGMYFSLYTFVMKFSLASGSAIGFAIAGTYGFDAGSSSHSPEHIFGLHLGLSYIPALMLSFSLLFIAMTPLTERRQQIIRDRLDARLVVSK